MTAEQQEGETPNPIEGITLKMPKTTPEQPYIEFTFDKKGKIKLSATSSWWGGINAGFYRSGGLEGNTCEPEDLKKYLKAFKARKVKSIKK
jgi:hypothetical protein